MDCDGWTVGTGTKNGTMGVSFSFDAKWTTNLNAGCVSLGSLYCFEE